MHHIWVCEHDYTTQATCSNIILQSYRVHTVGVLTSPGTVYIISNNDDSDMLDDWFVVSIINASYLSMLTWLFGYTTQATCSDIILQSYRVHLVEVLTSPGTVYIISNNDDSDMLDDWLVVSIINASYLSMLTWRYDTGNVFWHYTKVLQDTYSGGTYVTWYSVRNIEYRWQWYIWRLIHDQHHQCIIFEYANMTIRHRQRFLTFLLST